MKITPLDIKQKKFKKKYDRYDAAEVDAFLEEIRLELEEQIRENKKLSEEVEELRGEAGRMRDEEKLIKESLVSIQRFSEELREKAKREGELMISEAELEAERMISRAQIDASKIKDDINELVRQRVAFEASLRRLIDVHLKLLDATVAHDELPDDGDDSAQHE